MTDLQSADSLPPERSFVGLSGTPGQGHHMVIILTFRGERITDARYTTYPCPAAHACGRYVSERLEGMTADGASALDEAEIIRGVGNMPLGREHCPHLATDALRKALAEYAAATDASTGQ